MSNLNICCGRCCSLQNLGQKCPRYGGVLTDLAALPVGTTFYVRNGAWKGEIILRDGKKFVNAGGNICEIPPVYPDNPGRNVLALSEIKYPER